MVRAAATFLAVAIHVIPTQFPDDMFEFALLPIVAITHIKVRAALINVSIWAMLSLWAFFTHELLTDFQIVTEVTSLSIWAITLGLILLTSLDFAFVVRIRTCLALPALAMDKLLTDSICCQVGGIICLNIRSRHFGRISDITIHSMISLLWHHFRYILLLILPHPHPVVGIMILI